GPDPQAKIAALHAAMTAYDEADEKTSPAAQGSAGPERLTSRAARFWREIMHKKLIAAPAVAGLIVLPVAGLTALYLIDGPTFYFNGGPEKAVPNAANADRAQGKAVSKDAHDASHPAAPLPDAVFATPGAPLDTPTQRLAPGMP